MLEQKQSWYSAMQESWNCDHQATGSQVVDDCARRAHLNASVTFMTLCITDSSNNAADSKRSRTQPANSLQNNPWRFEAEVCQKALRTAADSRQPRLSFATMQKVVEQVQWAQCKPHLVYWRKGFLLWRRRLMLRMKAPHLQSLSRGLRRSFKTRLHTAQNCFSSSPGWSLMVLTTEMFCWWRCYQRSGTCRRISSYSNKTALRHTGHVTLWNFCIVRPRTSLDLNSGLRTHQTWTQLIIGYGVWCRNDVERVY